MISTGLKPRRYKDHRRYSYARTFGRITALTDCDFDTGLANPNQNEPNIVTGDPAMENGCTAETRADIATNEDRIIYRASFTYKKTCLIEGVPYGSPCTLESSFKSGVVYGLQAVGEITDDEALTHRRGPYFEVQPAFGSGDDYFNAIWSAIQSGKKCVSVGTPWYSEMTYAPNGIVDNFKPPMPNDWHNWEACGVKTTDQPRLKVKAWNGITYWFNSETVINLMAISGTDCLIDVNGKAQTSDVQKVQLTIRQVLISYLHRLINLLIGSSAAAGSLHGNNWLYSLWLALSGLFHAKPVPQVPAPIVNNPLTTVVPEAPVLPVAMPLPVKQPTMPTQSKFAPMIVRWSQAIAHWEGADPASNNPGNLKYSTLTASWGATKGRTASDGGSLCHFATAAQGQSALCNFLTLGAENQLLAFHQARTLIEFTMVYAGGPPSGYINGIANILGVPLSTNVSTFLSA